LFRLAIMRTKRYVVLRTSPATQKTKPLEFPRLLASLQVRVSGSPRGSSILPIFTAVVIDHMGKSYKGEFVIRPKVPSEDLMPKAETGRAEIGNV